jgi:hypothetical protein
MYDTTLYEDRILKSGLRTFEGTFVLFYEGTEIDTSVHVPWKIDTFVLP